MSNPLQKRTLWRCLMRTWSIGAAMSSHGMQRVGFLHAMEPALKELYSDANALQDARRRYLSHVRTHTVMASLLVGFCIALEKNINAGHMPSEHAEKLISTTATTLSAIGDSFFSATVLVCWALLCALSIAHGSVFWVVGITALLLAFVTLFRIYTFYLSVNHGLYVLQSLRKMNLINWAERIKVINAVLIVLFFWEISAGENVFYWGNEFWGLMSLLIAALIINKMHISRFFLVLSAFAILFFHSVSWVV